MATAIRIERTECWDDDARRSNDGYRVRFPAEETSGAVLELLAQGLTRLRPQPSSR